MLELISYLEDASGDVIWFEQIGKSAFSFVECKSIFYQIGKLPFHL